MERPRPNEDAVRDAMREERETIESEPDPVEEEERADEDAGEE